MIDDSRETRRPDDEQRGLLRAGQGVLAAGPWSDVRRQKHPIHIHCCSVCVCVCVCVLHTGVAHGDAPVTRSRFCFRFG